MDNRWILNAGSNLCVIPPLGLQLARQTEADILLAAIAALELFGSEVSGLAELEVADGFFRDKGLLILRQICSEYRTDIEINDLSGFYEKIKKEGTEVLNFHLWWHSHGDADVYFSSKDRSTIKNHMILLLNKEHLKLCEILSRVPDATVAGPFISLVVNALGDMLARCDFLLRREVDGREIFSRLQIEDFLIIRNFPPPLKKLSKEDAEFLESRYGIVKNLVLQKVTRVSERRRR